MASVLQLLHFGVALTTLASGTLSLLRKELRSVAPKDCLLCAQPGSVKARVLDRVGAAGLVQQNGTISWPWPSDEHDPWTAEQKTRAFQPVGHIGARRLLQKKISLQAVPSAGTLRIAILGGSMTMGHGCESQRWSNTFGALLRQHWPNSSVVNLAAAGTKSIYAWTNLDIVAAHKPDVIIVDYAINDAYAREGDYYSYGLIASNASDFQQLQRMSRKLMLGLLNLPWKPAVLYLETFTHRTLFGYNCKHRVNDFPHWAALKEFDIPVVSYSEAVCEQSGLNPGCSYWDADIQCDQAGPHAACWVHRAVGHLMADFFIAEAQGATSEGRAGHEHPDVPHQEDIACALQPLTKYVARPSNAGGSATLFPVLEHQSGWNYIEDMPGKPGWVASAGSPQEITFEVRTSGLSESAVLLEYLLTYEHVGTIACHLDEHGSEQVWKVDALVKAKVSLSDVLIMRLPSTAAGKHILRCRTDGRKFKILGLRSC